MRLKTIAAFALAAAFAAGCGASRQTTTSRTGVEQVLLTETSRESIAAMRVPEISGKTFAMKPDGFDSPEKHFAHASMTEKLLKAGGRLVQGDAKPDIDVEPRVDYAQIDDGSFFIGIPAIPIPIPGVGTVQTPELALFKRETQKARAKYSLFGVDKGDGSLAFAEESPATMRYYARWKLLIVISFRTTNLADPF